MERTWSAFRWHVPFHKMQSFGEHWTKIRWQSNQQGFTIGTLSWMAQQALGWNASHGACHAPCNWATVCRLCSLRSKAKWGNMLLSWILEWSCFGLKKHFFAHFHKNPWDKKHHDLTELDSNESNLEQRRKKVSLVKFGSHWSAKSKQIRQARVPLSHIPAHDSWPQGAGWTNGQQLVSESPKAPLKRRPASVSKLEHTSLGWSGWGSLRIYRVIQSQNFRALEHGK